MTLPYEYRNGIKRVIRLAQKMYKTKGQGGFNGIPADVRKLFASATHHVWIEPEPGESEHSPFDCYFKHREEEE